MEAFVLASEIHNQVNVFHMWLATKRPENTFVPDIHKRRWHSKPSPYSMLVQLIQCPCYQKNLAYFHRNYRLWTKLWPPVFSPFRHIFFCIFHGCTLQLREILTEFKSVRFDKSYFYLSAKNITVVLPHCSKTLNLTYETSILDLRFHRGFRIETTKDKTWNPTLLTVKSLKNVGGILVNCHSHCGSLFVFTCKSRRRAQASYIFCTAPHFVFCHSRFLINAYFNLQCLHEFHTSLYWNRWWFVY